MCVCVCVCGGGGGVLLKKQTVNSNELILKSKSTFIKIMILLQHSLLRHFVKVHLYNDNNMLIFILFIFFSKSGNKKFL